MEDEAAERKVLPDTTTHAVTVTPYSTQQAQASMGFEHDIQNAASTAWQQKVLDVEAKLQGDLQQDLAR